MRQSADDIEVEAARWVLRIEREGRAAVEDDLQRWLDVDSRRSGALLQAEAVWMLTGPGAAQQARSRALQRPPVLRRHMVLAGAGAAVAAGAGVLMFGRPAGRYATTVGEIRRVPLEDGSVAALNTSTAIKVDLRPTVRRVRVDAGEAWFQVAKDAARPFLVEVGGVRVQAVGTAFSVRRLQGNVEVAVSEGVVKVWTLGNEAASTRLTAGSRSVVAEDAEVISLHSEPSDIDRQLAWRAGKIDLAGQTVEQAAAEFNRYNQRKLVVLDPSLAREQLFGVFRTDDPEGFARAVHASLNASVSFSEPTEIRLSRAPSAPE